MYDGWHSADADAAKMSHCLFKVTTPFVVKGRRLFVLPGEVIEGAPRPGMRLSVPLNNSVEMTAEVHSVEQGADDDEVHICIEYGDELELELWQSMGLGDEDLILTEAF